MELGNLVFGNSRGEFPVPRNKSFEEPWERFTEAAGLSWSGYADRDGAITENALFRVREYDWDAECDCGADDKMEAWHAANHHGAECYQTELHSRMAEYDRTSGYAEADKAAFGRRDDGPLLSGFDNTIEHHPHGIVTMVSTPRRDDAMEKWREAHDRRQKFERTLFQELGKKHKVDPHYGAMVHCTCGKDKRADVFWAEIGGHSNECRFVQPNFLFKPTGFRLNWYKYPFRDSYMSPKVTPKQWREIMDKCIESLTAPIGE